MPAIRYAIILAPFVLVVCYLVVTLVLFFFGPFDWPVGNYESLIFFLVFVFIFLFFGYFIGSVAPLIKSSTKSKINYAKIGVIAGILLFMPMAYGYTGKMPWEVINAIRDQGSTYLDLQAHLKNKTTFRSIVSFLNLIFSPFLFSTIPLFIIYWKEMKKKWKYLFIIYLSTVVMFSLLRGTDKESADIAIMSFSGILVLFGRKIYFKEKYIRIKNKFINIILVFVILLSMFVIFVDRKSSRMGGVDEFCIYETNICSDYKNGALTKKQNFAYAMLTSYLAQGYYGLSIALDKDFRPTMGLGHSLFMLSLYEKISNDKNFYEKSYLYRMKESGWDDLAVWSTVFPWIANDTSFWGVPIVIFFLGLLFSITWREAVFRKNDTSAIVFSFLMIFFIYMPANNQIAQAPNSYFSFIFWLFVWVFQKNIYEVKNVA